MFSQKQVCFEADTDFSLSPELFALLALNATSNAGLPSGVHIWTVRFRVQGSGADRVEELEGEMTEWK